MSALSLVLLTQLALSCPTAAVVPFGRVKATVEVESGYQALAVHENWPPRSPGRSYLPATTAEAVALVAALHARGHSLDAGIMQVNDANWSRLGLTADTVFDPRANVCAGMAVLADAYAVERRVSCRYNTGSPDCRNGYPERIERAAAQLQQSGAPAAPAASPSPAVPSGPPPPPSWVVWAQADYLDAQAAEAQPAPASTPAEEPFDAPQPAPSAPQPEPRPVAAAPIPEPAAGEGAASVAMVTGTPVRP